MTYARRDPRRDRTRLRLSDAHRLSRPPVTAQRGSGRVARPVADAPPEVTTAVAEGSATGLTVDADLYEQDGTYYVVASENEGAVVAQLAKVAALLEGGFGHPLRHRSRERVRRRWRVRSSAPVAPPPRHVGRNRAAGGTAFVAALGIFGVVLGVLAVLFGFIVGSVPFGYSYWFARPLQED